ncbi:MAG: TIGR04211 family SH3 domain-containing protein [Gammaproteobacteria bacterium]|nr:TIGR04211 family SH3 domain-containing protein [Gammaproteobacteria bacterium]
MKSLLIAFSLFITTGITAKIQYVSDSLTIYYRTGPTHQFRIVGTLAAGQGVDVITADEKNKATQIRLASGRKVWVDTKQLMADKPSSLLLQEQAIVLQELTNNSNEQISDLQQELIQARDLASRSQALQQQVTQLEYDKELLEQKNKIISERSRYDLLTAGGVVAFVGLLLGLVLPRFIRRRRNDVWR